MRKDEASSTARVIAASTVLLASENQDTELVPPGAADLCRRFLSLSSRDRWLAWSASCPPTRTLWRWLERMTCPGIMRHYWHRKRWIETRCRNATNSGFGRLLVIGAGFDTLGIRLALEHPWLDVVELDHPATQRIKRQALGIHPAVAPGNLRFESVDLAEGLLPDSALHGAEATVVVAEGLLMYLSTSDVEDMFERLSRTTAERLRVVFTFMTRWPDGSSGFRPRSRLVERWMAWRGEPFRWAIEPGRVRDMLAARGFDLTEMAQTGVIEGENLVLCERRDNHQ